MMAHRGYADRLPRCRGSPTSRVFPLPLVLPPGELLPLHIFEPRYRDLVGRCLAGPEPFGVVLEDEAGVREVGCLARDLTVLERLADGRLNVVGERRRACAARAARRRGPLLPERRSHVLEDEDEELAEDEIEAALAAYGSAAERDRTRGRRAALGPAAAFLRAGRAHRRGRPGRPGTAGIALRARAPRPHHRGARGGPPQPADIGRARAPRSAQRQGRSGLLKALERGLRYTATSAIVSARRTCDRQPRSAGPSSPEADDRGPGVEPERLEGRADARTIEQARTVFRNGFLDSPPSAPLSLLSSGDDDAHAATAGIACSREALGACARPPERRRSRCCAPGQRTTCSPAGLQRVQRLGRHAALAIEQHRPPDARAPARRPPAGAGRGRAPPR